MVHAQGIRDAVPANWRRSSITGQAMILTLQAGNVSLALAGGKGANLARLLGAGFSVPGGFIITTRAYHAYVAANNLENWIVEAARRHDRTIQRRLTRRPVRFGRALTQASCRRC